MRTLLTTAILLLLSVPALALDAVAPVPPATPPADDVVRVFNELFQADLAKARTTPDLADDGALAERIFTEARNRAAYPDFVAYSLDQVVILASPVAGRQALAYDALRLQKTSAMRPARACLDKLLVLGPRVVDDLPEADRAAWISGTWTPDVTELTDLAVESRDYAAGLSAVSALLSALRKAGVEPTADLLDRQQAFQFLDALASAKKQLTEQIRQDGPHPDAHVALGILSLIRDSNPDKAKAHFNLSGVDAARAMATALDARQQSPDDPAAVLALGKAANDLGDKTRGIYFQAILWRDAVRQLSDLIAIGRLEPADKLRAETLRDDMAKKADAIVSKLPALVQKEITGGDETAAATFFGLPLRGRSIVIVVHRRSTDPDGLDKLKTELNRSLASLRSAQSFCVLFDNSGDVLEVGGLRLQPATPDNVAAASKAIDAVAVQSDSSLTPPRYGDPVESLRKGFSLEPDALVLLSSTWITAETAVRVDRHNMARKTVVHCIAYGQREPEEMLRAVATKHAGQYKYVAVAHKVAPSPTSSATSATPATDPTAMSGDEQMRLLNAINSLESNTYCDRCRGSGRYAGGRCAYCNGTGRLPDNVVRGYAVTVINICKRWGSRVPKDIQDRARTALKAVDPKSSAALDAIFASP